MYTPELRFKKSSSFGAKFISKQAFQKEVVLKTNLKKNILLKFWNIKLNKILVNIN